MAAHAAGLLLDVPGDRMLVTLHQRRLRRLGDERMLAQILVVGNLLAGDLLGTERIALDRVFIGEALGARKLVHAAVRTGRIDVVFEQDRAAPLGLDERQRLVGIGEGLGTHLLLGELQAVDRLGIHRHEVVHLIAAVDIQQLAGRAEAVRGIDVAAVRLVEVEAPVALVIIPVGFEVVNIGAFGVEYLAEQPVLSHVERRQLEEVIDTVLEHHAVALCLLGSVDQLPALVERHGGWDFDGDMLAVLHGINRHRDVQLPRGADVNQVDVIAPAKFLPPLLPAVRGSSREVMSGEDLLRLVDTLGVEVAERHDLDPVDVGEAFHGARAAHTQPDETYAYDRDRVDRQPQNGMLALGTGRDVEYDHAVDDAVTLRGRRAAPPAQHGCRREQ